MRPGRGVAEWHMLPSWNSLHTLLVARAVLLWHGASYPMLRCSSLARHPDLGPPTVPCARRPLFWYPIPVRIGSPTGDAWLTCQCASQSACSAFHNIRRLSLPSLAGEGTSHCAICWLRLGSIRWIYPLDYPLTDGSPRSVSRTRCLHPLVEVAWTEVLLLSGSHSLPSPPAARLGSLPLPSRSAPAPPAPRASSGPRALSSPVSV